MKTRKLGRLLASMAGGVLGLSLLSTPALARDTHDVRAHNNGDLKHWQKQKVEKHNKQKHKKRKHDKHYHQHDYYADADVYYDYARVINVKPLYRIIEVETPRRHCWEEEVYESRHSRSSSYTPLILGGIVGGVVGNQFGSGSGKDILTVSGAILGVSVGYDVARDGYSHGGYTTTRTRCEVEHEYHDERRISGYEVTYRYDGRTYTRIMDHDPGPRLQVSVNVGSQDHDW